MPGHLLIAGEWTDEKAESAIDVEKTRD